VVACAARRRSRSRVRPRPGAPTGRPEACAYHWCR
jgi:hypothetical protein